MLDQQAAVVLHNMKRQAAVEGLDRLLALLSDLDLKISPTIGRAIAQFPINISEDHLPQVRGIEKPFVILAQAFFGGPVIGSDILIEQAEKLVDIARFINKNEFLQQRDKLRLADLPSGGRWHDRYGFQLNFVPGHCRRGRCFRTDFLDRLRFSRHGRRRAATG